MSWKNLTYALLALLLSEESSNAVTAKLNEATLKSQKLNAEADELEEKAERARTGQRP